MSDLENTSRPRVRRREDDLTAENKKYKPSISLAREQVLPDSDSSDSSENMERAIQEAITKVFENPEMIAKLTLPFAAQCTELIEKAREKTEKKIEAVEQKTDDNGKRIERLEDLMDDFEQHQRASNLIIRGIVASDFPKRIIANVVAKKTGVPVTEHDIKYAIKITTKADDENGLQSYKVCFLDKKHRDAIYMKRMAFRGTRTYLSEDLTMKRSNLAFGAREYVRRHPGASTWSMDGKVFIKKAPDEKPEILSTSADVTQLNQA